MMASDDVRALVWGVPNIPGVRTLVSPRPLPSVDFGSGKAGDFVPPLVRKVVEENWPQLDAQQTVIPQSTMKFEGQKRETHGRYTEALYRTLLEDNMKLHEHLKASKERVETLSTIVSELNGRHAKDTKGVKEMQSSLKQERDKGKRIQSELDDHKRWIEEMREERAKSLTENGTAHTSVDTFRTQAEENKTWRVRLQSELESTLMQTRIWEAQSKQYEKKCAELLKEKDSKEDEMRRIDRERDELHDMRNKLQQNLLDWEKKEVKWRDDKERLNLQLAKRRKWQFQLDEQVKEQAEKIEMLTNISNELKVKCDGLSVSLQEMTTKSNILEIDCTTLRESETELKQYLAEERRSNEQLREERISLSVELNKATRIKDETEKKLNATQKTLTTCEQSLLETQAELETTEGNLKEEERKVVTLKNDLLLLNSQNGSVMAKLEDAMHTQEKNEGRIKFLERNVAELKEVAEEHKLCQKKYDKLQHQFDSLKKSMNDQVFEITKERDEYFRLLDEFKDKYNLANQELEQKVSDISSMKEEKERLETSLGKVTDELGNRQSELYEVNAELQATDAELQNTKNEVDQLRKEIEDFKLNVADLENKLSESQNKHQELNTKYRALDSSNKKLHAAHKKLQGEHKTMTLKAQKGEIAVKELASANIILGEKDDQIELLNEKMKDMDQAFTEEKHKIDEDREQERKENEDSTRTLQLQVDQLEADISRSQAKVDDLQEQIEKLTEDLANEKEEKDAMKTESEELKAQVAKLEEESNVNEIEKLKLEIEDLRAEVEELRASLKEAEEELVQYTQGEGRELEGEEEVVEDVVEDAAAEEGAEGEEEEQGEVENNDDDD